MEHVSGKVMTVRGPVEPGELGPTMVHEHVFVDLRGWFAGPRDDVAWRASVADAPVTMEILGILRRDPYVNLENTLLEDPEVAAAELRRFADAGGGCVVEMSCEGLGGNRAALPAASEASGVHIVAAAGFYREDSLSDEVLRRAAGDSYDWLLDDARGGSSGVLAGALGEMGTSAPVTEAELRHIAVAAAVAAATGLSLHIHLEPGARDGVKIMETATQHVPANRIVLGHIDLDPDPDHGYITSLAETGAYLALDTFGLEHVVDSLGTREPRDQERVALFHWLVRTGLDNNLVVSHDVALKTCLRRYGGYGYDHFLRDIAPQLEREGVSKQLLERTLVTNPRDLLTVAPVGGLEPWGE